MLRVLFEACRTGFHGLGCKQECQCPLGDPCHHVSGECSCPAGFTGQSCETRECCFLFDYSCVSLLIIIFEQQSCIENMKMVVRLTVMSVVHKLVGCSHT